MFNACVPINPENSQKVHQKMPENCQRSISTAPIVGTLVDIVGRKLDSKRRLTVRAGWRDVMGNPAYVYLVPGVIIQNGPDGAEKTVSCLEIVPPPMMDARLRVLQELDDEDPDRAAMERYCQDVSQIYFDTEGRIRIPERFLEYAEITDNVMMRGANDRIKVWAVDELDGNKKIDFDEFRKARITMTQRKQRV